MYLHWHNKHFPLIGLSHWKLNFITPKTSRTSQRKACGCGKLAHDTRWFFSPHAGPHVRTRQCEHFLFIHVWTFGASPPARTHQCECTLRRNTRITSIICYASYSTNGLWIKNVVGFFLSQNAHDWASCEKDYPPNSYVTIFVFFHLLCGQLITNRTFQDKIHALHESCWFIAPSDIGDSLTIQQIQWKADRICSQAFLTHGCNCVSCYIMTID